MWLIPTLEEAGGWGWAFVVLALGPAFGVAAMKALLSHLGGQAPGARAPGGPVSGPERGGAAHRPE
jgi:hypothetical protein